MEKPYELRGVPLSKREKIALQSALIEYAKRMDDNDVLLAEAARLLASDIVRRAPAHIVRPILSR
jgi:hypothetical protein